MSYSEKQNIENISIAQLLGALTIKQLWAVLGTLFALFFASFSVGQYVQKSKLEASRAELDVARHEQQSQLARLQFFERSFEYYRNLEIWRNSIGETLPKGWSNQYACNEKAIALVRSIEALHNTIKRLRDYGANAGIGVIDPRSAQLSKAGGDIQISFSPTGETWSVPEHFDNLNPDVSYRPGPCER